MNVSLILVILTSVFEASYSQRGRTTTKMTTKKVFFKFEGVDYDSLPPGLYEKNHDCDAHFLKCLRHTTITTTVCGWNSKTWYFDNFFSPCQIELVNCNHRVEKKFGIFGKESENELIYYNGEGADCQFYVRRGGNMMEAYFGNSDNTFDLDIEKIRNIPYKVRT